MSSNDIIEYVRLSEEIKALQKRQDELKAHIKKELGDDKEAVISGYKVENKIIISTTFDSVKLKNVDFELYQRYTKENITNRLTIKKI